MASGNPVAEQFVPNPTTQLREEDIRRSSDFRSIYTNHTAFNVSAFDFAMTFGEILDGGGGHLYIDQKLRVVMSPLHAKILAFIMMNNLKNYEAKFGEIKVPQPEPEEGATPQESGGQAE